MRDIRSKRDVVIHGGIIVNEAPQGQVDQFDQMKIEELRANLEHHTQLAKNERNRINGISFKLMGFALFVLTALSIWYVIAGNMDLAMYWIGLLGVFMPFFLAIKYGQKQSKFELSQLNLVQKISHKIRERTPI